MDLTPRHIQQKQFHDAFRGYNHEEVDLFLDEVAEAFEKVFRENQTLHHQLRQMEEQLGEARGSEDMLKRMLLTAQKTAEDAIEEARGKAQGMVVAAERKAQEIIANAERRAQDIVADAQTSERELQVSLEGLKRFDAEYRARLQAFIESQLRVLGEGPIGTRPAPAEAASAPAAEPSPRPRVAPVAREVPPAAQVPTGKHSAPALPERPEAAATRKEEMTQVPAASRPEAARAQPAAAPTGPAGREAQTRPKTAGAVEEEDEEERSIKELFWGDE